MLIKKFNNGNINMKLEKSDLFYHGKNNTCNNKEFNINNIDIDSIYNDEITMDDLYFNQINGYMYLVDYNTNNIYDFSNCYNNILLDLKSMLVDSYNKNESLKLYAVSKKEYKSLMEDLENGY